MLPSRSGTSGFALLLVALATTSCKSSEAAVPPPPPQPSEAEVTGILAAIPIGEQGTTGLFRIEVADAKVTLRNSANVVIANATTQLDGKFNIKAPLGTYDLCFDLQSIAPFCRRRVALNAPVSLGIVTARPRAGSIFGKVLTADGRACWLNDAFYKIDVATFLSVVRRRAVVQSGIRANIEGEYLIGGLSPGGYVVRADCEQARVSASLSLGSSLAGQNLTLPNRAPRIVAISASSGGQGISRPAAGSTIAVEAPARDPDGDPIEYLWRVLDGSGSIPGTNSSQQSWTMPPNAGYHSIYLLARDGKGGYDYQRLDIEVGAADVTFSGRVIDEVSQSPVGSATVKVGTVTTTTNSTGWFNMKVPAMASPERYVLNVQHSTYALLSRIHDKSAIGETYSLSRAQKTIHNPAGVIDVVDTNSSGPCGRRPKVTGSTAAGGLSTHGPVTTGPVGARRAEGGQEAYMVSVYSPSRNRVVRTRARPYKVDNKPCLHRGARVIVPAGALVDAAQNAPQGPVTLSFATMDPGRRALPGDYRAFDNNNAPVEMLSFGALYADFRDVNGAPLNLKTGTSAEIRVPVSAAQLAAAQPTIPIWSYDEKTGFWMQEGSANLTNTIEGWMYVGTTKHFSYLNMDVGGNDPAAATCVRLQIGQSLTNWQNLTLRAYVSYAGQFLQTKETALNGDQYHAIFRIPYAPPAVPPNTLRLEVRGVFQGTEVVLLDNTIYRISISANTYTDVQVASFDPSVATTTESMYGFFKTEGPPTDLGPYIESEIPESVESPHYAGYDLTLEFNQNYMRTMYGSDITVEVVDENGVSATDDAGNAVTFETGWRTVVGQAPYTTKVYLGALADAGVDVPSDTTVNNNVLDARITSGNSLPGGKRLQAQFKYPDYDTPIHTVVFTTSAYADFASMVADFRTEAWAETMDSAPSVSALTDFDAALDAFGLGARNLPEQPDITAFYAQDSEATVALLIELPEPVEWDRVALSIASAPGTLSRLVNSDGTRAVVYAASGTDLAAWDPGSHSLNFTFSRSGGALPDLRMGGSTANETADVSITLP